MWLVDYPLISVSHATISRSSSSVETGLEFVETLFGKHLRSKQLFVIGGASSDIIDSVLSIWVKCRHEPVHILRELFEVEGPSLEFF